MPKLHVIIASTRPGRAGLPVAQWFFAQAQKHAKFELELVDLKEVNLPLLDEPQHPRLQQYTHAHTKAWAASVKAADAFVFVTPEYNFSAPPALLNALDYCYLEWNYKPAAFVSYGGISGGLRSVQMIKQIATTLKLVPLVEAVTIPFYSNHMKDGVFHGTDVMEKSCTTMLDELLRWSEALKVLRS
jgi:NAD(P)H-dependent FMN reductase